MIAHPENERRHGMSVAQAVSIIVASALFMIALLALVPDS